MIDDLSKLRDALRDMPVVEPTRGFEDRVLATATARMGLARGRMRSTFRRHSTWWAAAGGALAASLAFLTILWKPTLDEPVGSMVLALNESREVSLVIDSERELPDATIRLYVTGSIAVAGYEQQHEIEWQTSLMPGSNLLSLPIVGLAPGDGSVVAVIEHEGRTRHVSVALHVKTPGDDIA